MNKILLFASISLAWAIPIEAATIVGTANSANSIPFGSAARNEITTYQQVYSATAFSGTTSIDTFSIFGEDRFIGNGLDNFSFNISFYTTSAVVNGLSETGADNLGTLLTDFGDFSISGALPDKLTFTGTPFDYDPTQGNLLLQFNLTSVVANGPGFVLFKAERNGILVSRYFALAGNETGAIDRVGIVTEFDFVGGAVPEPATWAFMIFGFGATGGAMRLQRKVKMKVSDA